MPDIDHNMRYAVMLRPRKNQNSCSCFALSSEIPFPGPSLLRNFLSLSPVPFPGPVWNPPENPAIPFRSGSGTEVPFPKKVKTPWENQREIRSGAGNGTPDLNGTAEFSDSPR